MNQHPSGEGEHLNEPAPTEEMGRLARIVAWLREGYPAGVPTPDFVPLLAILGRRLSKAEVKEVSRSLRRAGVAPANEADITDEIARLIEEQPLPDDVRRVYEHLAKKGWPVEFPDPE